MEQEKLPRTVETAQGEMSGFKLADELSIELQQHEAPVRKRQPGDPEVYNLTHAIKVFHAQVPGSRRVRDIMLAGARVGTLFAIPGRPTHLVLYKRERYRFFSRHFPNVPEKGHGVIANMKLVHWSAMESMNIATVFPDGSCYYIDAMEFWEYYSEYGTELTSLPGEIATPFSAWARLF